MDRKIQRNSEMQDARNLTSFCTVAVIIVSSLHKFSTQFTTPTKITPQNLHLISQWLVLERPVWMFELLLDMFFSFVCIPVKIVRKQSPLFLIIKYRKKKRSRRLGRKNQCQAQQPCIRGACVVSLYPKHLTVANSHQVLWSHACRSYTSIVPIQTVEPLTHQSGKSLLSLVS